MPAESIIEPTQREANESAPVTELEITGMTCSNCVRHVIEALRSVPGVQSAQANLDASDASVRWKAGSIEQVPALIEVVEKARLRG